jgi:hypothetical protein
LSGRTRNTRNLAWVRLRWTAPKSNVQGAAVLHCEALRHRFIAKFEISDIRGCFAREEGSRRRNGLVESYYILSWRTNSCRRPGRLLPGCANRRAPPAILGVRRTRWDGMRPRLVLPSPVIGASMVTVRGQLSWLFVCFFCFLGIEYCFQASCRHQSAIRSYFASGRGKSRERNYCRKEMTREGGRERVARKIRPSECIRSEVFKTGRVHIQARAQLSR